MNNLFVKAI